MSATDRAIARKVRIAAFLRNTALLSSAIALAACGRAGVSGSTASDTIEPGTYRVVLQLPGGELPFGLDLEREDQGWTAFLINGPERKIHTGFSGPATGEHYTQFAVEFKKNLEQLLAETPSS